MATHLVLGAGPVGTALAVRLARAGRTVAVVTRSGRGPEHPRVERVALDATDAPALADAARRGDTIVPLCPFIAAYLQKNEVAGAVVEWPGGTPLDAATQGESPA